MLAGLICPDGEKVTVAECLKHCRMGDPCLSPETIKMVGMQRPWTGKPSVTQLLNGTMLEFLRITKDYWVYPESRAFAVLGTMHHAALEGLADPEEAAEVQFETGLMTGRTDRIQQVTGGKKATYLLWDYKTWGSFRAAKFLGMSVAGYIDDPSGATYKRATFVDGRKFQPGDPKQVKLWQPNPLTADMGDLPLQVNAYRLMAEKAGFKIVGLKVQITVRDGDTVSARTNGIDWRMRSFPVPMMPDAQVNEYFGRKNADLQKALKDKKWDTPCNDEETWQGRRCNLKFCDLCLECPKGRELLGRKDDADSAEG